MAKTPDPYACGPQCCDTDPCDKDPLEILITNGMPQGKPDPCDHLPIAYDAATGCFYLWHENSGWFEASGVEVSMEDTDAAGRGDLWRVRVCENEIEIVNSRNYEFGLEALDDDPAGRPRHLVLKQTHGPSLTVDLNDLDSWVNGLTITPSPTLPGRYVLNLTQTQNRPSLEVLLPAFLTDVDWDDLCEHAELVSPMPDEALVLICTDDGVKVVDPSDMLDDLCFNIPDLGTQCGVAQQLVALQDPDDPTCFRLARYNAATTTIASFGSDTVYTNAHNLQRPANPATPATYYDYTTLSADAVAGTIDLAKLNTTRVATQTVNIECDGTYEFTFDSLTVFDPLANGGAGADSRVVFRIDGAFPLSAGGLIATAFNPFTNFVASISQTLRRPLTAGNHVIEAYIVRGAKPQAAQLALTAQVVGGGTVSRSNAMTIRKAVG